MSEQSPVFVLSREYPPITVGGTSTVARNLSVGLAALGVRVVVVTTDPGADADYREHVEGVLVHRISTATVYANDTGLTDTSLVTHRRLHQAANRLADELGPPRVVLLPDLFCYPEAALLAASCGARVVNVLLQDFRTLVKHDRDVHRVTSGVAARPEHLLAIEEKALRGSDHVVFISNALSGAITGHYPDLATPHSVVHLGVDRAEIDSIRAAEDERAVLLAQLGPDARDRPLLVACGRLVPVKGFAELVRATALLGTAGHTPHLALVGVGPEESHLRALVRELGLDDQVSFVGDVPRRTALTWMSLATVAVVPSLWESFCYVCAEMMALGRPVVATAIDSLNELVPSDAYGYRVPVTSVSGKRVLDPCALAEAIGSALRDPAEASRRAESGRAHILRRFTNDRFAERMALLCDEPAPVGCRG